jgi:hypothetical protein
LLVMLAAACGGDSVLSPSAVSLTGTWTGSASDSSISMGQGSAMGQAGMGTMTWPLTQVGSTVTGSMTFSGMQGRMAGTFVGIMNGDDMAFTMDLPGGSMMSPGCSSRAVGTAHVNRMTMMMTGTYTGSNSCSGPYIDGRMTLTRH